ncbi:MAG: dTDP-glucose 4,6-dehydratase [Patescibacteria group bacterium]|nr:dTDP-glucose 4,6-dehydratase [Patescibacteria group bacterium]
MKLLVTGGCGFIGSNFIRYWLAKYPDHQVVNLDKLTYAGHLSSTFDFSNQSNYRFVKGDICNRKLVNDLIKETDIVVHFAAETHVDRSILDPLIFVKTNVLGTQNLLDAALKNKIKRFHLVSTDEVFGELPFHGGKFTEQTSYNPRSPYAASKAAADHLARAYFYTYGLPVTITNTSNNYGPYQDTEKFIPRMITNLLTGENIKIYGDGKYVRDWLYVEDHVRAIDLVIKSGKEGETYLVGGSDREINNLEVAKIILRTMNLPDSKIQFVKDRPGHDRRYAIDSSKIRKQLNWKPLFSFDDYIAKTINWYEKNRWWWEPIKKKSEKLYKKTMQI